MTTTEAVIAALKHRTDTLGTFPTSSEQALQDAIWRALGGSVQFVQREQTIELADSRTAHRHTRPDFSVADKQGAAFMEVKLRDHKAGIRQLRAYMKSPTRIGDRQATEAILFMAFSSSAPRSGTIPSPHTGTGEAPLTIIDPFSLAIT
tara:strand:- start:22827 stop:23273 length:447 start_codon:yes stop_codon:yes gene_type:complete